MTPPLLLIALLTAHALADYPLQGDFLSKAKNRTTPIPGVPWQQAMAAHATIHAGAVALITGIWWLGLAEFVVHWLTDDAKCRGRLSFNVDQAIHLGCKVGWWVIALAVV
jgi:hypothetical protein